MHTPGTEKNALKNSETGPSSRGRNRLGVRQRPDDSCRLLFQRTYTYITAIARIENQNIPSSCTIGENVNW